MSLLDFLLQFLEEQWSRDVRSDVPWKCAIITPCSFNWCLIWWSALLSEHEKRGLMTLKSFTETRWTNSQLSSMLSWPLESALNLNYWIHIVFRTLVTLKVLVTTIDALGHFWTGQLQHSEVRAGTTFPMPDNCSTCQRSTHSTSKWIVRNLAL